MNSKLCILFSCLFLFLASCSEDDGDMVDPEMETEEEMNEDPQETGLLGELEITATFDSTSCTYTDSTVNGSDVSSCSSGGSTCSELFISEYVEGSSNNKAIEIANIAFAPRFFLFSVPSISIMNLSILS